MMTVMVDDGRRGWCWISDFNERAVVARLPPVLARRSLKIHWFRASVDGVIAGRAHLEEAWPPPSEPRSGVRCAGDPLLFRLQRVPVTAAGIPEGFHFGAPNSPVAIEE